MDYINPHATSTPVGDIPEINAIREVFGDNKMPPISSTKSLTGHSQGAAGVHEAIYSLLMMQNGFICESANIENIDPGVERQSIVRKRIDNAGIEHRAVQQLRLRRHQRLAGVPALRRLSEHVRRSNLSAAPMHPAAARREPPTRLQGLSLPDVQR